MGGEAHSTGMQQVYTRNSHEAWRGRASFFVGTYIRVVCPHSTVDVLRALEGVMNSSVPAYACHVAAVAMVLSICLFLPLREGDVGLKKLFSSKLVDQTEI